MIVTQVHDLKEDVKCTFCNRKAVKIIFYFYEFFEFSFGKVAFCDTHRVQFNRLNRRTCKNILLGKESL